MESRRKKIAVAIVLLIGAILIVLLMGHNKKNKVTNDTKFTISKIEEIPEGETKEYILPDGIVQSSLTEGEDIQVFIDDLKKRNADGHLCETAELSDAGQVVITVTQKQREVWFQQIEDTINERIEICKKQGGSVEIGDDMTTLDLVEKKGKQWTIIQISSAYVVFKSRLLEAQMFMGVKAEDCHVYAKLVRESTGKVFFDESKEGYDWTFSTDDWEE
ncbi:MAG: hypothetical protein PHX08_13905 [Lachnospiraceae bacterium]|nr:hypothetical protein [Lachnospiraceae bacterium]